MEPSSQKRSGTVNEFRQMVSVARNTRGISQRALAEKVGVTRNVISNIESGKTIPDDRLKMLLSEELALGSEQTFNSTDLHTLNMDTPNKESSYDIESLVTWFSLFVRREPAIAQDLRILGRTISEARQLRKGENFLVQLANESFDRTLAMYGGCVLGTVTLTTTSEIEVWRRLLETANESIKATSCLQPTAWWDTADGKFYLEANLKKARQTDPKIDIERVHIFAKKADAESLKQVIIRQIKEGIRVWVGFIEDGFPAQKALDFYIVDKQYIGSLHLQNQNTIQSSIFSVNEHQRKKWELLFEDMKCFTKEIKSEEVLQKLLG